ncbi:helix-turn-helix transcriptional regulator [Sulfurospirillum oryzae]|uniref:helix-turn-helix transcriptional regulator n=1 Tax=Sulfurospirillum oryzae TaxID=2976535 RepID=UPI0021E821A4|nr:response regulator transcription factor [Sulfurospirillum oryzae]
MVVFYSSHPDVIHHWQEALKSEEIQICHYEKALLHLLQTVKSNIILMIEERHYDDDGIESFLNLLQEEYPDVKTMVFSQKPTYVQGSVFLKLGIKAYGNTHMAAIHLQDALLVVKNGNIWLYPEFIQTMIQTLSSQKKSLHVRHDLLDRLSHKEREVALLIKEGLSNKEIALREGTTERTVKAHLSSIYEKIGVKDRLALALLF